MVVLRPLPENGAVAPDQQNIDALGHPKSSYLRPQLSHRERAVALRRDGVAVLPVGGMAAAVAHDPGDLLALDIAIDARHPGSNFVHQLPLAQGVNVIGPFTDTGGGGFDARQATLLRVADHTGHPLDTVFRGARVIAESGVRPHRHQQVREAFDEHAEIGLRPVRPNILQALAAGAFDVDPVESARDGVEPGRVDEDVERMFPLAGLEYRPPSHVRSASR